MNLWQVNVPLAKLPVVLCCLSDGTVVFIRQPGLPVYWLNDKGISAFIFGDCFSLFDSTDSSKELQEFEYDKQYNYRNHKMMLRWLQELNLQNPFTGEFRCTTNPPDA